MIRIGPTCSLKIDALALLMSTEMDQDFSFNQRLVLQDMKEAKATSLRHTWSDNESSIFPDMKTEYSIGIASMVSLFCRVTSRKTS